MHRTRIAAPSEPFQAGGDAAFRLSGGFGREGAESENDGKSGHGGGLARTQAPEACRQWLGRPKREHPVPGCPPARFLDSR